MRRRSNLLVLLGLASFVLGLVFVYIVTNDDGGDEVDPDTTAQPTTVAVVVAAEDLEAGTSGDDVLDNTRFRIEQVPIAEQAVGAIVDPIQLRATSFIGGVDEGEQLLSTNLRAQNVARAVIPEGFEAVGVNVGFVAGGAGTIQPGDRVNVFLTLPAPVAVTNIDESGNQVAGSTPYATPRAELLLTNALVLDVQTGTSGLQVGQPTQPTTAPQTAPTASGGGLLIVFALDTLDTEKVVFASTAAGAQLYLSRVRTDDAGEPAPPIGATPGQDFFTILAEEAGDAFARSNG